MRMKKITTVALMAILAGMSSVPAAAQPGQNYRPKPGEKSLQAVFYYWQTNMGMLRGVAEIEAVRSLEHQAKGVIQVDGKPCTLSAYRVSISYTEEGMRVQYTCKLANGQERKNIEVVSGRYAWDEDVMGAELLPGVGKATPKPALLNERLIRLWASPQGAPKAAKAGGAKTTVAWVGGKPVVTYPIPGVPGAIAKAALNDLYLAEKIEVRQGGAVTTFTYSGYKDWNNPLNLIDALYAGTLVEARNGVITRDLKTDVTETGNIYVTMPVPDSLKTRG